ncbi:MAG: amino acid ABC transporter substrate-binding protein [Bacteriovoracales bacterium]
MLLKILLLLAVSFAKEPTLSQIKKRKMIRCGVSEGLAGFSNPDSSGNWRGIDVDLCRALSAAIFNNPDKVQYVSLSAQQRFVALQSGEIDILSRNTTQTLTRDSAQGLNFSPVLYYDGQGFMVRKKDQVKTLKDLNGATICTQQGTTTELNMADYFRMNNLKFKPVVFESDNETVMAFLKGRCDALTSDLSGLAAEKSKVKKPGDYEILTEVISKEPLAAAVRHGDDQWYDIVKYTVFALTTAEEFGINSQNIDEFKKTSNPNIMRFLGITPGNGKALGLSEDWAYNIVKLVGNYEEIFERNVGMGSPLKIPRGLNANWKKGGLHYAPPFN